MKDSIYVVPKKIMPGIGCIQRRCYIENQQKKLDPCLMCDQREKCYKAMVNFQ